MINKNNKNITIHYIVHILLVLVIIGLALWLSSLLLSDEKECDVCPDVNVKVGNIITKIPDTELEMKIVNNGSSVIYSSDHYSPKNNIVVDYSSSELPYIKDTKTGHNLVLDTNLDNNKFIFIEGEPTAGQYKARINPKPGTQGILVYSDVSDGNNVKRYFLNPEPFNMRNIKCPMTLNSEATSSRKLHKFIML